MTPLVCITNSSYGMGSACLGNLNEKTNKDDGFLFGK